ncbi:MAG: bifunctional metallophosphatase/5'-nucleotidase [Sphaerochaetaceae bacterium]|nr:bifunctional metallophosphatase/5'-nucleotidase [Sphaerochaetaceae bacterium]
MKRNLFVIRIGLALFVLLSLAGCISLPPSQTVEDVPPATYEEVEQSAPASQVTESADTEQTTPVQQDTEQVPEPTPAGQEETVKQESVTEGSVEQIADEKNSAEVLKELRLVTTSDVHGMIFPYNFITDTPADHSLMQVSTYVKGLRESGSEVILLDNGDVLQGQPVVYHSNFIDTARDHIVPLVNNAMGYDVASVGNHDIEAGYEVYGKVAQESQYPYVAANAVWTETGEPVISPYVMIARGGLDIAVLGLTTPQIPSWLPQNLYPEVSFLDMVETAAQWVPVIQETEAPDLIVGLFHSGTGDSGQSGSMNENSAIQVAQQVDGFDIIFSGHDHKDTDLVVTGPSGKNVVLVGALDGARTVADVSVRYREDGTIVSIDGQTVSMQGLEADQELSSRFADRFEDARQWLSRKIGTIRETVSSRDAMFGDSKFVDLIHSMQLALSEADISISAPLAFDAEIQQGDVYVRDMFALYPYENLLYTISLTGRELDMMAEYSYGKWFNQMESLEDDLISFRTDAEGNLIYSERYGTYEGTTRYYNYDSYAGVNYTVDITKEEGNRVTFKTLSDGRPFNMDAQYTVAINSYRAQGGGGHLAAAGIDAQEAERRRLSSTIRDLRYHLMMLFEEQGDVEPLLTLNWKVLPSLWARSGMESSYEKLFGENR